jgi:hypothetical protein
VNTATGAHQRVLAITPRDDGMLYRFHERVESWFVMATVEPVARLDLAAIAAELNRIEPTASKADGAAWRADDPRSPVPELSFGVEGSGRSFGPSTPGDLVPSALPPEVVLATLRDEQAPR